MRSMGEIEMCILKEGRRINTSVCAVWVREIGVRSMGKGGFWYAGGRPDSQSLDCGAREEDWFGEEG